MEGSEPLDVDGDVLTPAEELRDLLETLVEALDLEAVVEVVEADDIVRGSVEGPELGLFVGRHGETIEAVQHLAQRIALRDAGTGLRVVVDAGGYRARREELLRAKADAAGEAALRERRPVELDAMTAAERRFVHEYLRERGDVDTHSEGDEPRRRLVVTPLPA